MAEKTEKSFTLDDVKKMIDAAVADALKDKSIPEDKAKKTVKTTPDGLPDDDEYVSIMIPMTHENKADVFLSLNDESCIIKRGQRVMIKKKFARVYEDSRDQETAALMYMEKAQSAGMERLAGM